MGERAKKERAAAARAARKAKKDSGKTSEPTGEPEPAVSESAKSPLPAPVLASAAGSAPAPSASADKPKRSAGLERRLPRAKPIRPAVMPSSTSTRSNPSRSRSVSAAISNEDTPDTSRPPRKTATAAQTLLRQISVMNGIESDSDQSQGDNELDEDSDDSEGLEILDTKVDDEFSSNEDDEIEIISSGQIAATGTRTTGKRPAGSTVSGKIRMKGVSAQIPSRSVDEATEEDGE